MKLTVVAVAIVVSALALSLQGFAIAFALGVFALYLVFGVTRSLSRNLDPLNDLPNAFRVLLAALAPLIALSGPRFFGLSVAVPLILGALLLNDEYQRRTFDSVRRGRVGGAVAILGIDGSGKSTHSAALARWFVDRGYYCTYVPFHRYLFVEKLGRKKGDIAAASGRGGNALRPFLSALDNLALNLISSFGRGLEGRVVLFDRYTWSTYVKYSGLGYPVRPLRWLYMLPRPKFAFILDIPVERSLGVIRSRERHIRYEGRVLETERGEYLRIAEETGFPVVDASREFATVQADIESYLARVFPRVGGGN